MSRAESCVETYGRSSPLLASQRGREVLGRVDERLLLGRRVRGRVEREVGVEVVDAVDGRRARRCRGGPTPTMSNRSQQVAAEVAARPLDQVACRRTPGPPGLTSSEPMRLGPVGRPALRGAARWCPGRVGVVERAPPAWRTRGCLAAGLPVEGQRRAGSSPSPPRSARRRAAPIDAGAVVAGTSDAGRAVVERRARCRCTSTVPAATVQAASASGERPAASAVTGR